MTTDTDLPKAIEEVEHLVRNWVNDSTQLDGMTLKEMVLYALREEEKNTNNAVNLLIKTDWS